MFLHGWRCSHSGCFSGRMCIFSCLANTLMSFLNLFHRVCGLITILSVGFLCIFSSLSCSAKTFLITLFRNFWLFARWSRRVHLPLLISGADFGAYFTVTIQWSVGTGEVEKQFEKCVKCIWSLHDNFVSCIVFLLTCFFVLQHKVGILRN